MLARGRDLLLGMKRMNHQRNLGIRMNPTCPRNAFTLIELLVVIAIIALLAALIVPGVSAAKKRADSSKCTANLRQMAMAVTTYAVDHEDWLPPGPNAPGVTTGLGSSQRATYTTATGTDPDALNELAYYLTRYLGVSAPSAQPQLCAPMRCPAAWKRSDQSPQTYVALANYCLTQRKVDSTDPNSKPAFGTKIDSPYRMDSATRELGGTKSWMITDSDQQNDKIYTQQSNLLAEPPHETFRNVVFFDAHVFSMPVSALTVDDAQYAQ